MNRVQFVQANRILLVPISQIVANPFQKRVEYGDIGELADRIAAAFDSFPETLGLMQVPRGRVVNGGSEPVSFQKAAPVSEDSADWTERGLKVQLMYGHRRYEAFKLLIERDERYGRAVMPIQITDATSRDMLLSVWEENERRQNLSAIEQAHLMAAAKAELGESASQRDVAEFFGLARPTVANRMSLLDLPEEVQSLNRTGKLSERQLLAMKPLYELRGIVGANNGRWDNRPGQWNACHPETYINYVIEHPETTSDDIREMVNKVEKHAGQTLPKELAEFQLANTMVQSLPAKVEQAVCKGCPFRRNSMCLKPSCLKAKKLAFARQVAEPVAQECGVQYSDDKKHFESADYAQRDLLREAFLAGQRCPHMVIGWSDELYTARPFGKSGGHYGKDHYEGRNGIILGHIGPLKASCITAPPAEDDVPDLADAETLERWKKAVKKQEREIKERVRRWFEDRLYGNPEVRRLMLAFIDNGKGLDGDDDKVNRALITFVIGRMGQAFNVFTYYNQLAKRIEEAGLKPTEVLEYGRHFSLPTDRETILKEAAIRVLAYWYEHRKHTYGSYANDCLPEIDRLAELIGGRFITDPELLEVSAALDVAARDIRQKLAKDGQK